MASVPPFHNRSLIYSMQNYTMQNENIKLQSLVLKKITFHFKSKATFKLHSALLQKLQQKAKNLSHQDTRRIWTNTIPKAIFKVLKTQGLSYLKTAWDRVTRVWKEWADSPFLHKPPSMQGVGSLRVGV